MLMKFPMNLVWIFGMFNLGPKIGIELSQLELSCHFLFDKVWDTRNCYKTAKLELPHPFGNSFTGFQVWHFHGLVVGKFGLPIAMVFQVQV